MSLHQRSSVPPNSDTTDPVASAPTTSGPITSTRGLATSAPWPFPMMSQGVGPWGPWGLGMNSAVEGALQGTQSVSTTASISLSNPTSLASSTGTNASSVTSQNTKQSSSQLHAAQIAGICVGALFVLIISLFIIRRCIIRRAQKRQHLTPLVLPTTAIPYTQPPSGALRPFTKRRSLVEAVDIDERGENDAGSQIADLQLQMRMLIQSLAAHDGLQQSGASSRSESPPEYAPPSVSV